MEEQHSIKGLSEFDRKKTQTSVTVDSNETPSVLLGKEQRNKMKDDILRQA